MNIRYTWLNQVLGILRAAGIRVRLAPMWGVPGRASGAVVCLVLDNLRWEDIIEKVNLSPNPSPEAGGEKDKTR